MRVAIISLLALILASCGVLQQVTIREDEIGVVYDTLTDELQLPLPPGTHFVDLMTQSITIYPTFFQNYTFSQETADAALTISAPPIRGLNGEGVQIEAALSVVFRIVPEQINQIHAAWLNESGDYRSGYIRPVTSAVVRDVMNDYTGAQLRDMDYDVLDEILRARLFPEFMQSGFLLDDVRVRDIRVVE